jgi:hypothetical protein
MASSEVRLPEQTIALVHNSALPNPLSTISIYVAEKARSTYFHRPTSASNYLVKVIDIATFDIPFTSATGGRETQSEFASGPDPLMQTASKSLVEWQEEAAKHVVSVAELWGSGGAGKPYY